MGLTFTVGRPADVFVEPHASYVREVLARDYQLPLPPEPGDPYYTQEVGWSGWEELQKLGMSLLHERAIPHLVSMEAWQGVYLPLPAKPAAVKIGKETLKIASLPSLVTELEAIGRAAGLPTADAELAQLAQKYLDDDDLIDEDMAIQTYAQLLQAAHYAQTHREPLWVVK